MITRSTAFPSSLLWNPGPLRHTHSCDRCKPCTVWRHSSLYPTWNIALSPNRDSPSRYWTILAALQAPSKYSLTYSLLSIRTDCWTRLILTHKMKRHAHTSNTQTTRPVPYASRWHTHSSPLCSLRLSFTRWKYLSSLLSTCCPFQPALCSWDGKPTAEARQLPI